MDHHTLIEEAAKLPDGTHDLPNGIRIVKGNGIIDITDEAARSQLVRTLELYEMITCNLFPENINDASERMALARMISNVIEERLAARDQA